MFRCSAVRGFTNSRKNQVFCVLSAPLELLYKSIQICMRKPFVIFLTRPPFKTFKFEFLIVSCTSYKYPSNLYFIEKLHTTSSRFPTLRAIPNLFIFYTACIVTTISLYERKNAKQVYRLRGDFLQTRVSGAQKSNESDSRLRNLGKVKMAGNFFIVRVFPGSIYKHNRCGLVPF